MSKLIRLTSNLTDGSIDNDFNEDILIKANSKIALKNISLTLKTDDLIINNNNNQISFTSGTSSRDTYLFNETVHPSLWEDLINNQFNDVVNRQLLAEDDNSDFNTQFSALVNTENKMEFVFFKSILFDFIPSLARPSSNILINELSGADIVISNTSIATTTQQNQVIFSDRFIQGAGVFRCKIKDFVDNTSGIGDNGFSIGLTENPAAILTGKQNWTNAERTYEIKFNRLSENYQFLNRRLDGDTAAMNTSTVAPLKVVEATHRENDILEIMLSGGSIIGNVYINNVKHELFIDTNYGDPSIDKNDRNGNHDYHSLYPYIIMNGSNDNIKINCIQHSFNESRMQNYDEVQYPPTVPKMVTTQTILPEPKVIVGYSEEGKFLFSARDMQTWFGFNDIEPKATSSTIDKHIRITADNIFEPVVYHKSIVVEMQNISLNSFDSIKRGRFSILEIVPDEADILMSNNVITYEPHQLNFIQMSNITDILQRSFRIRLLNKYLQPIKTRGLIVLTILIQD